MRKLQKVGFIFSLSVLYLGTQCREANADMINKLSIDNEIKCYDCIKGSVIEHKQNIQFKEVTSQKRETLEKLEKEEQQKKEKAQQELNIRRSTNSLLTSVGGVYYFGNQRETYYNLDMSGVVSIMRDIGYPIEEYPYWVREDGVKMFGDYVMIAADLGIHPRGSLVETSLGMAIVCDTGGFTAQYPYGVDIAVVW